MKPGSKLWYVGDTVDDARSATAAGVPFIGIIAPGRIRSRERAYSAVPAGERHRDSRKRQSNRESRYEKVARIERNTKETQISGSLSIEGRGTYKISTGIRFLDHMLELFAKHGGFDLTLQATGDLDVDQHHTVEDCGIVLGQLFCQGARRPPRHQSRRIFRPAHG